MLQVKSISPFSTFKLTAAFWILFLFPAIIGCKKFVQVDAPPTGITSSTIYSNNVSAASVMSGMYSNIMASSASLYGGNSSIGFLQGLAADELISYSNIQIFSQFYQNALMSSSNGSSNSYYWTEIYREIYVTNTVIENLSKSSGVSFSMKQQLDGEAKFMRAFLNFYATNLYGEVPIVTSTDYLTNNVIKRSSKTQVYGQIIADLKKAKLELSEKYVNNNGLSTTERIRPNKVAAQALLARVYLFNGDWKNAEMEADSVINNSNYELVPDLNGVFLKNSKETIWQLQSISPGYNTFDGYNYVLTSPPGSGQFLVALDTNLVNSFEANDERRINWIGTYTEDSIIYYYYPYKYKQGVYDPNITVGDVSEYTMVLRLAEQLLIRAEARAQQGNIVGAQNDLNTIRTRSGLSATSATSQASLLSAILHERRVELFTEWGNRWFDLIRTGSINYVLGSPGNVCQKKGGNWNANWALLPIPMSELQINRNLYQNNGY
jgi:hypothetical protein